MKPSGLILALLAGSLSLSSSAQEIPLASPPLVIQAMEEEISRSLKKLRLENFGPSYFIAYRLVDQSYAELESYFGAPSSFEQGRTQHLYVEVRYGNYSLDNVDREYQGIEASVALNGDPQALRQALWSLSDSAYKNAVSSYLRKKGNQAIELQQEKLDDFSREQPQQHLSPSELRPHPLSPYRETLGRLSALGKEFPFLIQCVAALRIRQDQRILVTSEGTRLVTPFRQNPFELSLQMHARSSEGFPIRNQRVFYAPRWEDLPPEPRLREVVLGMIQEVRELLRAPQLPPYTGPALLDPESTATLFHEAVGHRLEGERQREEEEGQTFKEKLGEKILPPFLSLSDDPTLDSFQNTSLNGHYAYDSEGVPAQRVLLVEKGILKGFLLSRRPIHGFSRSNGHARAQAGNHPLGRMVVLIVQTENPLPKERLQSLLQEECRKQGRPY